MHSTKKTPKIADYGLIGNSRACALISKLGSLDWCCLPQFDSPALFTALLDIETGGQFSICPKMEFHSEQDYLEDTNILRTVFHTQQGSAMLLDCFTVFSEEQKRKQLWADQEILRVIQGQKGEVLLRIRYFPKFSYGRIPPRYKKLGSWGISTEYKKGLLVLQASIGTERFQLTETRAGTELLTEIKVKEGETLIFSLVHTEEAPAIFPPLGESALARLNGTLSFWRQWMSSCTYQGPYFEEVRRSALVLKLLTFAPSGGIIAAPTTSLPEVIGGSRNWDYRYCWLRDASFTARAWVDLGFIEEAKSYVNWLLYSTGLTHPRLQVLYNIYGESRVHEKALPELPGYACSFPVRVGNGAIHQFQMDTYGELLDALSSVIQHIHPLDKATKKLVIELGKSVCQKWMEPDNGIWEFRSERVHHTHSKVMSWVALDRIQQIALHSGWKIPDTFPEISRQIRNTIEARGYNSRIQAYAQTFEGIDLDASLLVMPIVGYCSASSYRMQSTIRAIQEHLSVNGFVYRYLPETDELAGKEGAFGICNFWMAQALALSGELCQAYQRVDSILNVSPKTGLFSEEIEPSTGEFLGNFPQAFTHIGLIRSALCLASFPSSKFDLQQNGMQLA